jgi:hypothetical protein
MPITVTAPRGTLTARGEREILPQLTTALVNASGLTRNTFFTGLVGGTVHLLEPGDIYAGGVNRPIVMVELKLPNIGLPTVAARSLFRPEPTLALIDQGSTAPWPGWPRTRPGDVTRSHAGFGQRLDPQGPRRLPLRPPVR